MNLEQLRITTTGMPAEYQLYVRSNKNILPVVSFEIFKQYTKINADVNGMLYLKDLRNLNIYSKNKLFLNFNEVNYSIFGYRINGMKLILG